MANVIQFDNNAETTVGTQLLIAGTTLTVNTGDGALFSTIASPSLMYLTLDNGTDIEIVQVTTHTAASDSFTIVRSQEGTTAIQWEVGDTVELRVTAGIMDGIVQSDTAGNARGVDSINLQPGRNAVFRVASGVDSIAIGRNTEASALNAIALGVNCEASASYTVAIGDLAYSTHQDSITIGRDSVSGGIGGVAIGYSTNGGGAGGVAVGDDASAGSAGGVGIGDTAAGNSKGVAIGKDAICNDGNCVSVGYAASSGAFIGITDGTAVGYNTTATAARSTALGSGSSATGTGGLAIGDASSTTDISGIAIGDYARTRLTSTDSIAIGTNADVNGGLRGVAIGKDTSITGDDCVAIGYGAYAYSVKGTSVGYKAYIDGSSTNSVALGKDAYCSTANSSVALGGGAGCLVNYTNSFGNGAKNATTKTTFITYPISTKDNGAAPPVSSAFQRLQRNTSAENIITTEMIDATATSNTEIEIPSDFFVEEVGAICVALTTLTTQPNISVGTTSGGVDIYASTITTKLTAVGGREKAVTSLVTTTENKMVAGVEHSAIQAIWFNIATAATATALGVRFYARGHMITSSTTNSV